MVIELSAEQTEKYFAIVSQQTTAEINEDCLPSGATITINIAPPFGNYVEVNSQDIGEVLVEFVDG